MYHALVEQPPRAGQQSIHIEVSRFAQQLAWLHAQGYAAITVAELDGHLASGQLPAKTVVLTFDDGYLSLRQWAAPLLARYDFRATLFLTTDFVGEADYSAAPADFAQTAPPGDRPLTWPEIRELSATGWAIEAHSCAHWPHAGLAAAALTRELTQSRQLIERELGSPARFYAFPYGSYDRRTLRALGAAGYRAGFSVHGGLVSRRSDRRRLPRIELNTSCELPTFSRLVRTGYASTTDHYRARLRNALFHFPLLKDGLRKARAALRASF